MRTALAALVLACASAASAQDRPAHPAVRYSCMSDPPPGVGWPWVTDGVPYAIEVQHPGYGISHYTRFAVAGLSLFSIEGGPRGDGLSERYAYVQAADATGAIVEGRALFLRSVDGVSDPYAMALRAMAVMMRRADEAPLRSEPADVPEWVRGRVTAPAIDGRTLTFWIRNRADMPYVSMVTVDLDTGALTGDPG